MKVLSSENKLNIDIIKSSKLLGLWSIFMIVIIVVYLTTETIVPKEFKFAPLGDAGTDSLSYFYKVSPSPSRSVPVESERDRFARFARLANARNQRRFCAFDFENMRIDSNCQENKPISFKVSDLKKANLFLLPQLKIVYNEVALTRASSRPFRTKKTDSPRAEMTRSTLRRPT